MGCRIYLRAGRIHDPLTVQDLRKFLKAADARKIPGSQVMAIYCDDDEIRISCVAPLVPSAYGPPKKKKLTKRQIKVRMYIIKNRGTGGYVPPMGKSGPPKQKKVKCPVCNTRKLVVKVSGVQSIKHHVSKGQPCPGSGIQVVRGKVKVEGEVN